MSRTGCGGPKSYIGVRERANVNVKDRLIEPACEDISLDTDNLLGPDEGVYYVIYLCAQKIGILVERINGKLIEQGEI